MPRGYDRPLYIQPFDHRGSFQTKMFGWQSPLSDAQTAEIAAAKRVIYDGFLAALAGGVPKEKAGILVDEQFGAAILRDGDRSGCCGLYRICDRPHCVLGSAHRFAEQTSDARSDRRRDRQAVS